MRSLLAQNKMFPEQPNLQTQSMWGAIRRASLSDVLSTPEAHTHRSKPLYDIEICLFFFYYYLPYEDVIPRNGHRRQPLSVRAAAKTISLACAQSPNKYCRRLTISHS